ncbi:MULTISPECIES: alpha/beta hydrolase [unclassified Streptomyces]|uniref:alpha/beta hydrolase n=1 Tax=unclassified Streptomyces TaxID=2593676 RepID=UPI002E7FC21B|nr:alpha/beta hydrolase [Streptomyces sp. NBC_00562]WTD37228.1 alpha/beta hydrolase [Streptomyces sp. NBC_01643]WUC23690.1 alpha/beta hydrolase [Streptomyces sp. NBC_00562]
MLSRHRFDPELAAALAMMPEVDITDVDMARAAQAEQLAAVVAAADTTGVDVEEVSVPGPDGAPNLRLRIYRPQGVQGLLPAVYSIHGGGFVLGSPDVDHDWNLLLCRELAALVVSVDYRLAPEHPFPAPLEDCYAGLRWLATNAGRTAVRADRIALWGDSAGAGLAAALTLLARDRGGPAVCFQHLCSPALDDRLETPSARLFTDTPVWNRRSARLSWDAYLGYGVRGTPGVSPYAAPGRAGTATLSGLPPAYVSVMEFDPLRDEGIDYARALLAASVPTELHLIPGTFHGAWAVEHAAVIQRATDEAITVLRRALGR